MVKPNIYLEHLSLNVLRSLFFILSYYFIFKVYFIDYAITVVPVFSPFPPSASTSLPSSNHPLSSCPWVTHISSLAFPFPILLLTSSCLFCTYLLCFLISVLYPCPPLPTDNPPFDRYIYDSVPVLVVCLVSFCFFRFGC